MGNCLCCNLNGSLESDGLMFIRGKNTHCPTQPPDITVVPITWSPKCVTISRVPLHNPAYLSKFLKSMIGIPTFNVNLG